MTGGNTNMQQVCRASIEGTMDFGPISQQYVNVHHWEFTTSNIYGVAEMDALALIYTSQILPALMDCLYSSVTSITNLRLRNVQGDAMVERNYPLAMVGSRTLDGDLLPPYSALVVSLRTNYLGKRYRGRNFLGGFAEQDQQNGIWEANTINLVEAYCATFTTHIAGPFFAGDWMLGVLSDPERTLPDQAATVPENEPAINGVIDLIPQSIVYTQKKRKYRNLLDIS